jgi:hypothetical protein
MSRRGLYNILTLRLRNTLTCRHFNSTNFHRIRRVLDTIRIRRSYRKVDLAREVAGHPTYNRASNLQIGRTPTQEGHLTIMTEMYLAVVGAGEIVMITSRPGDKTDNNSLGINQLHRQMKVK